MAFNPADYINSLPKPGSGTTPNVPPSPPSAPPATSGGVPGVVGRNIPPPPTRYGQQEKTPPHGMVYQKYRKTDNKEFFSGFITEEGFAFLQQNWGQKMGFNLNWAKSGGGNKPVAYVNFFKYEAK